VLARGGRQPGKPGGEPVTLVPALYAAELPQAGQTGRTPPRQRPDSAVGKLPDTTSPTIGTLALPTDSAAVVPQRPAPPSPSTPGPLPLRERGFAQSFPTAGPLPVAIGAVLENGRARMSADQRMINQNAVELHKKFAISVACMVFVLVGAPIALRFPRGGVGLVIGASLVIFGIYYVGLIAGEALADKDLLTPFWAMWGANILLTAAGLVLLVRMGRESTTTRGGDLAELLEVVRGFFRRGGEPAAARGGAVAGAAGES
jgi:lipopolysaccharide export system permease protein